MASRDTVRLVAPELTSESDSTIDAFLTMAARRCSSAEYGDLYADACVYLAAHLLTLRSRGAAGRAGAGPVTSEETGDLGVTYGAVVGVLSTDAQLATTPYGVEYLNLRRLLPPPLMSV